MVHFVCHASNTRHHPRPAAPMENDFQNQIHTWISIITWSKDSSITKEIAREKLRWSNMTLAKCNYQNNGEMMKGTNHKKMVKAKWGDDDRWMQGLKIQSWERKGERERRKGILKGKHRVGANRINGRQGTLNGHSCGVHYANLGSVTFPFPFFDHVHVKVRTMMFFPMFLFISLLLLHFYFSYYTYSPIIFFQSAC